MGVDIRVLHAGEADVLIKVAPDVFDDPIDIRRTEEFLRDPRHHLAVALDGGVVVGFVSAVHYVHPDKPSPELWINEIGVAQTHRSRGLATALLQAALEAGRKAGCGQAWVLTDRANIPAMRLYASGGGVAAPSESVMFTFYLDEDSPSGTRPSGTTPSGTKTEQK